MSFLQQIKKIKPLESPVSFTFIALGEKLIPLVLLPIFINDVGVEDYGMLFLFVTVNNIVSPVLNCGFSAFFVSKYYEFSNEKKAVLLGNYILVQLLALVGLSLILLGINRFTGIWSLSFADLWVFMVLTPLANNLFIIVKEAFQIKIAVLTYLILVALAILLEIGLSIYFLKVLELGWESRLYAMVSTYVAIFLLGTVLLRKEISIMLNRRSELKEWWHFGSPLIVHRISGLTMGLGDRLIIDTILGHYYLGLYTVSQQVSAPISMLANAVKSAWNPWFYKNRKEPGFSSKRQQIRRMVTLGMIVMWGLFIFSLPLIYDFLIKDVAFEEIEIFVYLISLAFILQTLYFLEVPNLMIKENTKGLARITLVSGLVIVIGNVVLTNQFQLLASCALFLAAWVIQFCSVKYVSLKIEKT